MKARLFTGVALVAILCSVPEAPASDAPSIYETLTLMKEHSVLSVAVTEAKEAAALKAQGPFTLFAPTDAAFKKLDAAAVKALATDREAVRRLLRAHLVTGKLTAGDLKKLAGKEVRTLQGGALKVEDAKDGLRVGGAKVTVTDVQCGNGVIHVIDAVLPTAK